MIGSETEKQREKEKDNFDRGPIEERRVEFESRMTMMMKIMMMIVSPRGMGICLSIFLSICLFDCLFVCEIR